MFHKNITSGYDAASNGNPLPTFRDSVCPIFKGQEFQKNKAGKKIRCPETSVKDYHSTLRNTPEEGISHLHRGGSLKSRIIVTFRVS
jgi:hypothetical protein